MDIANAFKREVSERLNGVGFPKYKDALWKHTSVLNFKDTKFKDAQIESSLEISKLERTSLEDIEDNYFSLLSLSNSDIKHIKADRDFSITKRVSMDLTSVLVVDVKGGSEIKILEENISENDSKFIPLTIFNIGKDAKVEYTKISNFDKRSEVIDNTIFFMDKNSELNSIYSTLGSRVMRNTLKVILKQDAKVSLDGIYIDRDLHLDNSLRVEHRERSFSSQKYKGVVVNGAASFLGSIYIPNEASSSSAHQLNRNLILGEGRVNSAPLLEIFVDDVSCSHGSTTGDIDKDQILYMQSRGLSLDLAKRLLIEGYLRDVLDGYSTKERVLSIMSKELKNEV